MTFLRVAQALLEEVWQSVSRNESAMDLDEDDEQPTGPLTSQAGAFVIVIAEPVSYWAVQSC